MKNQFNKFICKLFGHKFDEKCMMDNNVEYCFRCFDSRAPHFDGTTYWTDKEYYGLIGYPIYRLKGYILSKYVWIKLKTGKLKIQNKDNYDENTPF